MAKEPQKHASVSGGEEINDLGRPVEACPVECARQLQRKLLKRGKTKRSLMEQLFAFMELRSSPTKEEGDALTFWLGGFDRDDHPAWTNNACKTLGDIFEALLTIVYSAAFPHLYSKDFKELRRKVAAIKAELPEHKVGKFVPDFLIAMSAREGKYRAGNGEGSTAQKNGALSLLLAGYEAVMLLFRISPNARRYANGDWKVKEAMETVALIKKETGIDILEVIEIVGRDPEIARQREIGRESMMRREAQESLYRIENYGLEMIANDPAAMVALRNKIDDQLAAIASMEADAKRVVTPQGEPA